VRSIGQMTYLTDPYRILADSYTIAPERVLSLVRTCRSARSAGAGDAELPLLPPWAAGARAPGVGAQRR